MKNKSQYFTRISSRELTDVQKQVIAGVLNEAETLLLEAEKTITASIKNKNARKTVLAEVGKNLEVNGIRARFASK